MNREELDKILADWPELTPAQIARLQAAVNK